MKDYDELMVEQVFLENLGKRFASMSQARFSQVMRLPVKPHFVKIPDRTPWRLRLKYALFVWRSK